MSSRAWSIRRRKLQNRVLVGLSNLATYSPEKLAHSLGLAKGRPACLPDFLGIGAQKAGTAWLYRNLGCHPELSLSARKELHYFDTYFFRSLKWYAKQFIELPNRLKGEITPAYSILPNRRIRFIRRIMPNVKLILMIRDPVERAWSRARMNLMSSQGWGMSFEEIDARAFYRNFRSRASVSRGSYTKILENWLEAFPQDQVFIGFFDDIEHRPRELLADIFGFLGVTRDVDWNDYPWGDVIHASPTASMPPEFRDFLEDVYSEELSRLESRFGARVAAWRRPAPAASHEVSRVPP